MSNLLNRVLEAVQKPKEVINSAKNAPSLKQSAVCLALIATTLASTGNVYAQSYEELEPQGNYTKHTFAEILGESKIVIDQIETLRANDTISIDQGSDYLNYQHPMHSKINDYLQHAKDNYTEENYNKVVKLAELSQQQFNNGHYKNMDKYAHYLMPLTDDSPIFIVDYSSETDITDTYKLVKATEKLFNAMKKDPNFEFEFGIDIEKLRIPAEKMQVDRTAINDQQDSNGYAIAFHSKEEISKGSPLVTFMSLSFWEMEGFKAIETWENPDSKENYMEDRIAEFNEALKEAYQLTHIDIDCLKHIGHPHELGHLAATKEMKKDGAMSEFMAESMSIWNHIQMGASEGYLEVRKDANTSTMGITGQSQHSHDGYAYTKTFFDQYSHSEIKSFSLDEMIEKVTEFTKVTPEGLSFGEAARRTAQLEIMKKGAFPNLQNYLELNNSDSSVLKALQNTKEMPNNPELLSILTEQRETLENPNSSLMEKFIALNLPTQLDYKFNAKEHNMDISYDKKLLQFQNIVKQNGQDVLKRTEGFKVKVFKDKSEPTNIEGQIAGISDELKESINFKNETIKNEIATKTNRYTQ